MELADRSAVELAAALAAGEVSSQEVVAAYLERIAARNPELNAIVTLDAEGALATAAERDAALTRGEPPGLLHGLPVAVKDLEETAGMRTTFGSPLFRDHVPTTDSLLVERLRAAGAVIVGKTNTPEFGAGSQTFNAVFGATRNPCDPARTPGGSSGGAAAAVAAGMLPFADGSDLGASVRNPASFCGLVGLRPSPGRIPAWPSADLWSPLSVHGPIARSVADATLLLRALCGPDPHDPLSLTDPPSAFAAVPVRDPTSLRIAWSRNLGDLPVEPAVTAVLEARRAQLEARGVTVVPVEPDLTAADEAFATLRAASFAHRFGPWLRGPERAQLKATVVWNAEQGLALSAEQVMRATERQADVHARMRTLLADGGYDALALPTAQVVPFAVETEYPREIDGRPMADYLEWMRSCSRITVSAHPAVSIPAGTTPDGLPVGLQLVGAHRGEAALLGVAASLEI